MLETGGANDLTFETASRCCTTPGHSVKWYYRRTGPTDGAYFKQFQTPGLPTALYNSIGSVGTLFGDGTPGRVGDPTNPTPAATRSWLRGGLRQRRAARRLVHRAERAPSTRRASRGGRPVPRHQAGGPGLQRGAVELHVFVLNYDENDGFFDHVSRPPRPSEYPEEFVTLASPGTPGGGLPVGAGFRVPCFPHLAWTVGGRASPKSPTTPPASGSSRRWPRPAACPARARLPSPTPAAGGGRRSATSPGPCAGQTAARAHEHPVHPATRRPTWPPSRTASLQPLTPRPGATQQFPVEPRF